MKFIMHEALLDPCEKIMNCRQNPDVNEYRENVSLYSIAVQNVKRRTSNVQLRFAVKQKASNKMSLITCYLVTIIY